MGKKAGRWLKKLMHLRILSVPPSPRRASEKSSKRQPGQRYRSKRPKSVLVASSKKPHKKCHHRRPENPSSSILFKQREKGQKRRLYDFDLFVATPPPPPLTTHIKK